MEKFRILNKTKIEHLPKTTGVYLFYEKNKIVYIGKAINIKNRVKNHFQQSNYKDNLFVDKITKIGFLDTASEIEALILEANLIKKYQPRFNVIWKDDKNYFYVAITKSLAPIIYITHQPFDKTQGKQNEKAEYVGPFVEGLPLKKTLKFLRRVFPYYATTLRRNSGQARHPKNNCTWCHLELCPGPNPDLEEYKKNIKKLVLVLKGKRNTVLNSLKKEMSRYARLKEFEKAAKIRDKISNLQRVMSHTGVIESGKVEVSNWSKTEKILKGIIKTDKNISRIEAYDVSNIQGKQATGSMVVFISGRPDKNLYRKFKIKIAKKPNDIAMLKETLERRLAHLEWKQPEIMLIDGGKAQLNIGIKVKQQKSETRKIKIISIAKKYKELFVEGIKKPMLLKTLPKEIFDLIMNLDDEAHRFAIAYHKKLRKKYLLK